MNGRALHEIGVDPLADATLFALQQCGEGAVDGELGGTEGGVGGLDENRSRWVQRVAERGHETGSRHDYRFIPLDAGIRSRTREAADRRVDEPWFDRPQRRIIEPGGVDRGVGEGRHEDVGLSEECSGPGRTVGGPDVRDNALWPAGEERIGRSRPQCNPLLGLEADHLRSEVGEEAGREGPGDRAREFDYAKPAQWCVHVRVDLVRLVGEPYARAGAGSKNVSALRCTFV